MKQDQKYEKLQSSTESNDPVYWMTIHDVVNYKRKRSDHEAIQGPAVTVCVCHFINYHQKVHSLVILIFRHGGTLATQRNPLSKKPLKVRNYQEIFQVHLQNVPCSSSSHSYSTLALAYHILQL